MISAVGGLAGEYEMPVKGRIDLSSNFCEFRPAHFHGGIDIRTGGKEGRKIYSPVDGYVWRIKYSYTGYGKGLYLKDSDGRIFVFGHLSQLSDRLEKIVKDYQYQNEVYSFDNLYGPDSITVAKGELIAYSGQSGFGAPHIHFEIRDADNRPLNPLTNGFAVPDEVPPEVEKIGFIYADTCSVFPNGDRRYSLRPDRDRSGNVYTLAEPVALDASFGISLLAWDRIRPRGPRLNIYKAALYIDDYLYYEVVYESYDYAETRMVDLNFDYFHAVKDKDYWYPLFIDEGMNFSGNNSLYSRGGIFEIDGPIDYGMHHARVELFDAADNKAEIKFDFIMLPPDNLFSAIWVNDTTCYVESNREPDYPDIAEIVFREATGKGRWREIPPGRVDTKFGRSYQLNLPSGRAMPEVIKIDIIGESGWIKTDQYVIVKNNPEINLSFKYSLIDGGILFEMSSNRRAVLPPEIEIVYDDGYSVRIPVRAIDVSRFAAFYKESRIQSRIVRFDLFNSGDEFPYDIKNVNILHAVPNMIDESRLDYDNIQVAFRGDSFYSSSFFEVKREAGSFREQQSIVGNVYTLYPETIPLAGELRLSFKGDDSERRLGVYRLNDKGRWVWRESVRSRGMITVNSHLMGTFALLKDTESPRVKKIYPPDGKTVFTARPEIRCEITENLSGIENHENIQVYLDGVWLIPEYDPETELMKTCPPEKIADGRHNLKIIVSDRAGNSGTVQTHFFVNTKKN